MEKEDHELGLLDLLWFPVVLLLIGVGKLLWELFT